MPGSRKSTSDGVIAEILAWVNVILGALITIFTLRYIRKYQSARWIKLLYGLIGAYWCGIYLYVAFNEPGVVDPVWFGQVFIRPVNTITLAVIASRAIYRWRSHG